MTTVYSPEDEIVTFFLKMMIDYLKDQPSNFLQSEAVYRTNPSTHFNTSDRLVLHDGRFFFVYRSENSGKTDECEHGCWRVIGRDKLIKSKLTGKVLGFKRILKFLPKKKPESIFMFSWEKQKRRTGDQRKWVIEEYRLANEWKQDYVICKIRLLEPNPLEFLLSNHMRGYYI